MLIRPVATPARVIWIEFASFGAARPRAANWKGISLSSATASSRSLILGFMFGPRTMTGPPPRRMSPSCRLLIVGQSVAWVTSTAMPTSGSTPWVLVRAPRRPISSHTVDTAYTATFGSFFTTRRSASMTTHRPVVLSILGALARPLRNSWKPRSRVTGSPTRTAAFASSPSVAPMSSQRFSILTTRLRSSMSSKWIGLRAMTAGTGPSFAHTVIRWPMSCCGSQPPIGCTQRKPLSSM